MYKDDFVQAVVIVFGTAAVSFALAFMFRIGIKQEALFALIGALIGAAATIGGAAWLAHHSRTLELNAEVTLLVKEYRKLLKAALAANDLEPGTNMPWPKGYRSSLYRLAETAGNTHAIAGEALAHGKFLTFIHRAAVRRVQFAIDEFLRLWTDSLAEKEEDLMDERTFPATSAEVIHECKVAIAELSGTTPFADET